MISKLILVKAATVWSRETDYKAPDGRVVEPLVIDAIGHTWLATGERDGHGRLIYARAEEE